MNQFIKAMGKATNKTTTENGAKAFKSTKNAVLDLFAGIGGMRGKDSLNMFINAHIQDPVLTARTALWARDVRGGAGERQAVRNYCKWVAHEDYELARRVAMRLPDVGRWDDLLSFYDTAVWHDVVQLIGIGLRSGNGLCAKWMPRKGIIAESIRQHLGLTPKQYRKTLVNLTNVVEQQMCANQWSEINYNHVPSKAAQIYNKAFGRHDKERYMQYKADLTKGTAKINAGAVYPYEIVDMLDIDAQIANAQWKAQPDYVQEGMSFLPIVDVSGSMWSAVGNTTAIDIAMSLGIYLAERNKSVFKDYYMTFSATPTFEKLKGDSLNTMVHSMKKSNWGMNTDLQKAFNLVLERAIACKVKQSDMPTHMLIVSDMQFNGCVKNTNTKEIKQKYEAAGYKLPILVFWCVTHKGTYECKQNEENVILVSGFSASIMKTLLKGEASPLNQMLATIMDERYNL